MSMTIQELHILTRLCEGADRIRKHFIGDKVDLCSIINGRSGKCPEDCKYCAQSAHNHTDCEVYDFLPEEDIVKACKLNESEGVDRFSIVTAGKALTGKEFEKAVHAYETMNKECDIELCASMGFLNAEQLHRLHEAGVTSYHHNIETSRRNFPNICTTHTYDMKIETLKLVKAEGMWACSGGIIGMGESWEDRLDMAISLAEVGERNNSSYYGDEYMNTISRAVADMEDIVSRRLNLSYHSVSKESIKYINDIYEKSHELLKAYCNLTDEDIAGLPDMSQADILTLITRRSFE